MGESGFVTEESLQLSWAYHSAALNAWGAFKEGFLCIQALVETSVWEQRESCPGCGGGRNGI